MQALNMEVNRSYDKQFKIIGKQKWSFHPSLMGTMRYRRKEINVSEKSPVLTDIFSLNPLNDGLMKDFQPFHQ